MSKEKIHVLLIEDDPDDYVLTRAMLGEMEGYEVVLDWASNYEEGNRKIKHGNHNAVLVDYRLGQFSGIDILQNARNQCAAPLILLTGQENHEIDVAATRAGAADYLVKRHINAPLLERSIRYAMHHKRVESAWRSALLENNRLATAITNLPIGVIITDSLQEDQPIIFVNPAFTEITGYSMMEVTGRNCRFLQGPETDKKTVDEMRKAISSMQPFQGKIWNYRKNGTPFWNELRLQPLFNEGQLISYVGLLHDITTHVEAEQMNCDLLLDLGERVKELSTLHAIARILQEETTSEAKLLQKIVEQIPPAFRFPERMAARLKVDSAEYFTPHFQPSQYSLNSHNTLSDGRGIGLEVVYQAGKPVEETPFIEEEHTLLKSLVEMICSRWERDIARKGLQEARVELEARVASRTLELEMRTNELRNSGDRLRKINQEILELSRLKSPQSSLEQVFAAFTEAAVRTMDIERASVWLFSSSRDALQCIDLFEKQTGAHSQSSDILASDFPFTSTPFESDRTLAIDDVTDDPRLDVAHRKYMCPQGITSVLVAPILKEGSVTGFFILTRLHTIRTWTLEDQTYAGSLADLIALEMETLELQKTQESLRLATLEAEEARRSAEDANSAKSEFLSRMSHELRTPLNSILGFGQLLQHDQLTDKQRDRVDLVVTAGRHLLSLINEVLDIARVESGRMTLSIEPVHLDSTIQEALSLIAPLAASHNIALINDLHDSIQAGDFFVLADRQKLHQILLNLLSNAVKYNKENGYVRVVCKNLDSRHIQLSVINTGHGIDPENLARAFIPFERLEAEQSNIEGTGLGLTLVQRLVAAMSGKIDVESTPDEETVFAVTLPIAQDLAQPPRAALDKAQHMLPQEPLRVLYIEDNLTNLRLIESIFSEMDNVQLITAMQGRLGLELAREHQPDLILLDLHLPDIGGDEVLANLKSSSQTREIPVVIVSADATITQQKRLRDQGAHHYLTKPLDINLFMTTINEVVKNKSAPI